MYDNEQREIRWKSIFSTMDEGEKVSRMRDEQLDDDSGHAFASKVVSSRFHCEGKRFGLKLKHNIYRFFKRGEIDGVN